MGVDTRVRIISGYRKGETGVIVGRDKHTKQFLVRYDNGGKPDDDDGHGNKGFGRYFKDQLKAI